MKIKTKLLAAKPAIDAAIKQYGFAAVKYVVNKRTEQARLERQLESEKEKLKSRIAEIQSKLKS